MPKQRSLAPIIVAAVLLLPILYVVSYLVLVVPRGTFIRDKNGPHQVVLDRREGIVRVRVLPYRAANSFCRPLFWPLEQIDRRVRPREWNKFEESLPEL